MSNDTTKNLGDLGQLLTVSGTAVTVAGSVAANTAAQFDNTTNLASTAFVKQSGTTFSTTNLYNASATLPSSVAGSVVEFYGSTAAQTLTLPLSASARAADSFTIFNYATVPMTVSRQGAEVINVGATNSVTSIVLQPGDSLQVMSSSGWTVIGGTAATQFSSAFGYLAAMSGYQKLPSGIILQWGPTAAFVAGTDMFQTLPIAFPNAAYIVMVCQGYTNASGSIGYLSASFNGSLSQFTWRGSTSGNSGQYIAIGR